MYITRVNTLIKYISVIIIIMYVCTTPLIINKVDYSAIKLFIVEYIFKKLSANAVTYQIGACTAYLFI